MRGGATGEAPAPDLCGRSHPRHTAPVDVPIGGWNAPGFDPVRRAFAENFAERGEVGAAACVIIGGEVVVDLVGGWADEARTRPWEPDTLVDMYSAGKAVVATLALQLVDQGRLDLDAPLADVWPEFAQGGKERATLRHALSHRAGVPAIREPLTDDDLWDWDRMTGALAATDPWWEPGTRHAYHTNTYGHLVGETVRRAGGDLPGARLRAVAEPAGVDLWIGVPPEHHARCADVLWAPPVPISEIPYRGPRDAPMHVLAHLNPPGYSSIGVVNTARWREAQVPSTNGHGSARGLARFYAALLEPGRLLSPDLLAEATSSQSSGPCPILGEDVTFGLGFVPTTERRPLGPNPRSFGHFGTGGALGFADPDAGVAFGYVMNHVIPRWQSTRNRALIDALYDVL
jgi:CubicO group peptidase (beta-lactamase class C family)